MVDGAAERVVSGEGQRSKGDQVGIGRVLALEVRPSKLGFVVFDGPTRILDWGVRNFTPGGNLAESTTKRIGPILDQYTPSDVILRRRRDSKARLHPGFPIVLRASSAEANRRSIRVRWLSTRSVKEFFRPHGYVTKQEIASAIAERFAELVWKLPPKRKPWQSEGHNMVIFDAASLGVAFFAKQDDSLREVQK